MSSGPRHRAGSAVHDKSWRARDAQRLRQGQVAVDGLLDHRILHVCFEPLDVQPELGRNSEYKIGIGRAVGLHECLMEGQVAALAVRSQGRLGSINRVRAEDGELLVDDPQLRVRRLGLAHDRSNTPARSGETTSELQSLMRISYAVFCLTKKSHAHIILW